MIKTILLSVLCAIGIFAQTGNANAESPLQNYAIWTQQTQTDNQQIAVFRKTFNIADISDAAKLEIFADSRYLLWINGTYVMRGPCRFNPSRPEYDAQDVTKLLHKGENSVVVMVHNLGNSINGKIMKGLPMLTLRIYNDATGTEYVKTDSSWKCNDHVSYRPTGDSWNTVCDQIDGRIDNLEWKATSFDDSKWSNARPIASTRFGKIVANELPLPKETVLSGLQILPSKTLLNHQLPITLTEGQELVVDCGKMSLVYCKIQMDAKAGSELSIQYALRYRNGKACEMFGGGSRYIAREGAQEMLTTDQWGCHYVVIRCTAGKVVLNQVSVTERVFPFERLGKFNCNDALLNDLWNMAVNTIQATADDAYGTDVRERNEWIQDCVKASFPCSQVALAAPEKTGKSEMRLLRNTLRHAALSQLTDGRLRATFPTDRDERDCHYFIDDYACQWFEGLYKYVVMTGDSDFAQEMLPHLKAQMSWFESQKSSNGLYLLREYASFDNPLAYITCQGATVNAFLYQAFTYAEKVVSMLGMNDDAEHYRQLRSDLYRSYNELLWNKKQNAYNSAIWNGETKRPTVHAQLIALQCDIVPTDRIESARKWLWANYKNPGMRHCCTNLDSETMIEQKSGIDMPIVYYWMFSELYRVNTDACDTEALNEMRRKWTNMVTLQKDAGTLSESFVDENGEGSDESCHNYGVIPVYFLSSYVLGVRFDMATNKIIIEPHLGDLQYANGSVVTPLGTVDIAWQKKGSKVYFNATLPDHISATLRLPAKGKNVHISQKVTFSEQNKLTETSDVNGKFSGYYVL